MKKRRFLTSHFGSFIVLSTSLLMLSACLKKGEMDWNPVLSFNSNSGVSINYSAPAPVYTNGSAITPNSPSVSGGTVLSYSVSPALPAGLSLDTLTGVISGTPAGVFANSAYMISGVHSSGVSTAWVNITVNDIPPSGLSYTDANPVYTDASTIADNIASSIGGAVVSYSVSPALPSGLSLNTSTGVISGTPSGVYASSTYTITATNTGGSTSTNLNITVNAVPPNLLSYTSYPVVYTVGSSISTNSPMSGGGAVVSYSVSPALPAGLSFNTSTGAITGTPTIVSASQNYTITATNSGGSTNFSLNITVNDAAPTGLSYSTAPAVYTRNSAITNNIPSYSGGIATSFSVSPALPAGLSLNTTSGLITGTPTAVTSLATYTITATNSGGSTNYGLNITVNDTAPTGLSYSTVPGIYTVGSPITNNNPSSGGGAVVSYSISPSLPSGLSLNTSTGVISGTPTVVSGSTLYTVTATNTGGNTTFNLNITVNDVAPNTLTYSSAPAIYTVNSAITANTPSYSGGIATSFSVSPALPAGLSLNTSTGFITGTPTAITASTSYTVTATNSGGSTNFNLNITVNDVAPSALTYSTTPAIYTVGSAIVNNIPSSGGGAVVSYSVAPALPAGLTLNTSSGVISGTPTAVAASASFTITATNSGGNTNYSLDITVNDIPPSGLSYSANPATYPVGVAISNNTPTVSGGAVVSYSVAPALPTGLTLNASTGVISGTPTTVTGSQSYTVTATNSGGTTNVGVTITIADSAPTSLSYSANPVVYVKNTFITLNTPSYTGGTPTSYSVSPGLPPGLSIDITTGVISGMPMTVQGANTYTVTASNVSGSTNVGISISVNDLPPYGLAYSQNPVTYLSGAAITSNVPSIVYGSVTSYSVSPSLPSGLSFDSGTGVISGNPSVATPQAKYTVTASGPYGSTNIELTIAVESSQTSSWTGGYQDLKNFETGGSGSKGSIDGAFNDPRNIAIDTQRNFVYIVEAANWRISRYDLPTGTFKGWIGGVGVQPTGGDPGCVSANPGSFTPGWCTGGQAGIGTGPATGPFGTPTGIALDVTNNILYITDSMYHRVQRHNAATGALTGWIGTVSTVPTGGDSGCTSATPGFGTPGWCIGGSSGSGTGDGRFNSPQNLALDPVDNILYVADTQNNRIQRINAATGISTGWFGRISSTPSGGDPGCAGASPTTFTPGWCLGGAATSGSADGNLNQPQGLAVDHAGNKIYVADTNNNRIQRFNLATAAFLGWNGRVSTTPTGGDAGCTSTFSPNNTPGWCFGGTASSGNATGNMFQPRGIALDPFNSVYFVSDNLNYRIQKFNYSGTVIGWSGRVNTTPTGGASGCTSTAPGLPTPGWCTGGSSQSGSTDGALNGIYGLAHEPVTSKIYIAESASNRISVFSGFLGNFVGWLGSNILPQPGWSMNGLPLSGSSVLNTSRGITVDSTNGNIIVADEANHRIVRIDRSTGAITGWIGRISVTPTGGAPGCASTNAPNPTPGWCTGGAGSSSGNSDGALTGPSDVAVDTANDYLYVLDRGFHRIVRYVLSTGSFAGWIGKIGATPPTGGDPGCSGAPTTTFTPGWCTGGTSSSGNGDGMMNNPDGIAFVSGGYLLVSDTSNNRVNKFDATTGGFLGWIGRVNATPTGGAPGCTSAPVGTFTPGWCLGGTAISSTAGDGSLYGPKRIGVDPSLTFFYVANSFSHMINKYNVTTGNFVGWIGNVFSVPTGGDPGCTSTSIGNPTPGWCIGGSASIANSGAVGFASPQAVHATSNFLYVTDTGNGRIFKYDLITKSFVGWRGMVSSTGGAGGSLGGPAGCSTTPVLAATPTWCTGGTPGTGYHTGMFNVPGGIASDGVDIYVSDTGNSRIMKLNGL